MGWVLNRYFRPVRVATIFSRREQLCKFHGQETKGEKKKELVLALLLRGRTVGSWRKGMPKFVLSQALWALLPGMLMAANPLVHRHNGIEVTIRGSSYSLPSILREIRPTLHPALLSDFRNKNLWAKRASSKGKLRYTERCYSRNPLANFYERWGFLKKSCCQIILHLSCTHSRSIQVT